MEFQLLITNKMLKNNDISCFKILRCCIYPAKNVKMSTTVGILTFISRINVMLSSVDHEQKFYNLGARLDMSCSQMFC